MFSMPENFAAIQKALYMVTAGQERLHGSHTPQVYVQDVDFASLIQLRHG